jgi:Uncharacterized protein containing a Zn-ribbon (DUF2116)
LSVPESELIEVSRSIETEEFFCFDASARSIVNDVTIGQFKALAEVRGWSADWLVEQCRDEMDDPKTIIREILQGWGMTKPSFTGEASKPRRVSMLDTALVWRPLLALYCRYHRRCVECETALPGNRDKYCSQRCQKRAYRREQKGGSDPRILENRPA